MKDITVSITEGRKEFSRLVQGALNNKEKIIITKRRKPLAVIIPYDEYQRSMRFEGYKRIMETRKPFWRPELSPRTCIKNRRINLRSDLAASPFRRWQAFGLGEMAWRPLKH